MTLPLSPFRATQTKSLVLFCPVKRPEELHSSRLCSASLLPAAWTTRSHGEPLPPSPTPFYTFIMKYKYCYGLLIFFFFICHLCPAFSPLLAFCSWSVMLCVSVAEVEKGSEGGEREREASLPSERLNHLYAIRFAHCVHILMDVL